MESQKTIAEFCEDYEIPYLHNYDYVKGPDGKLLKRCGKNLDSSLSFSGISKRNAEIRMGRALLEESERIKPSNWINIYYKFMEELFILDIDDTTIEVDEINEKVKEIFGFVPPYTLSSTKQRPHYILNIENFPNKEQMSLCARDCFLPFTGDFLIHVVEVRNSIVHNLQYDSFGDIVFTPLNWEKIKKHFDISVIFPSSKKESQTVSGKKDNVDIKDIILNSDFSEQIEAIKNSKYFNDAFDLVNIVPDKSSSDKFRFKANKCYDCVICKRRHIKNNMSILVDCSKGGIGICCRQNQKMVFIKDKESFNRNNNNTYDIMDDDLENIKDYNTIKTEFELDNLHFYCSHTKKFYEKEECIDKSVNYNPHSAQEFKVAKGNVYYDEVVTKNTKDGIVSRIEKKSFIDRWMKDEKRKTIIDFVYDVNPDYKANKDYINLWTGFDILKTELIDIDEDKKTEIISIIDKFFNNLGGSSSNAKDISKYFKSWVAHIIQRPHVKQITVPYLQSDEEGAGKTTLPVFIGNILGDENCLKYVIISNGFDGLNETFNSNMRDCFVFCADELRVEDGNTNYSKFKKETSSPNRIINTKYGDIITIPNKIQMCITSNNISAIPIPKNQRRLIASELTTELHSQDWFGQYFYPMLKDKKTCRFIYEYFKTFDITDYAVSDIPESDYAKLVSESSKDLIEKYIDANYEFINGIETEILGEALFTQFNNWCEKNKIKPQIPSSIGMKIAKNKYAKLIFSKRRLAAGNVYSVNKEEVAKYFNNICDIEL
jgi:hypothetical protein